MILQKKFVAKVGTRKEKVKRVGGKKGISGDFVGMFVTERKGNERGGNKTRTLLLVVWIFFLFQFDA